MSATRAGPSAHSRQSETSPCLTAVRTRQPRGEVQASGGTKNPRSNAVAQWDLRPRRPFPAGAADRIAERRPTGRWTRVRGRRRCRSRPSPPTSRPPAASARPRSPRSPSGLRRPRSPARAASVRRGDLRRHPCRPPHPRDPHRLRRRAIPRPRYGTPASCRRAPLHRRPARPFPPARTSRTRTPRART